MQPVHVKDNIFSCIQDPDYFFFIIIKNQIKFGFIT